MNSVATLLLLALTPLASCQIDFSTSTWQGLFADGSGVLQSLTAEGFDFSPSDVFSERNGTNNYHLGDLNLRFRTVEASSWTDARTAAVRNISLTGSASSANNSSLLTSDLTPALPAAQGVLNVSRSWSDDNGDLALSFTVSNVGNDPIELGNVGMPIEFNNIFTGRTAVNTTNLCVLYDPYIGLDAGYVQVSRLTGTGPEAVVTPLNSSKFEAWNFLPENTNGPLYYQSQTYEGNYEWLVYSLGYAEQEWNATQPWNTPTSTVLAPQESAQFGLRFSKAEALPDIEPTVAGNGVPVANGIPGYVLPQDAVGSLYLNYSSPVSSIDVEPAGALTFTPMAGSLAAPWVGYSVGPSESAFGRVRATVTYGDGKNQSIHYHVAHSAPQALDELGTFAVTNQVFNDTTDPFHRAPSIISYDHSTGSQVLQDNRAWIAGLSDEGGAGSFLATSMKQVSNPVPAEVSILEEFVNQTAFAYLQLPSGPLQFAVRKSLFFYEPDLVPGYVYNDSINWAGTWDRNASYLVNRAYDYVHVSALYWALYNAEVMSPGILQYQSADWYLNMSYNTIGYALDEDDDVGYANLGLMGETVWGQVLQDLYLENMTVHAGYLESYFRQRQQVWASQPDPYGSEMAWDSTGEEGVYYWSAYFNDTVTADKTLAAIRGYMPTIPHWGYNGNARRYWDFLYAGSPQLSRIERQIHHYGSGLNSQPLLQNYRTYADPSSTDAIYDLRVGYGGHMGPLSNIQEDGFGSMAFHSYANTLIWDGYSGDYGPGFLGHVLASACYIVQHPTFGYVAFGGNLADQGNGTISVEPRDSVRRRVYVAPVGLWVTFDAGVIGTVNYDEGSKAVSIDISAKPGEKTSVVMNYQQTAQVSGAGTIQLATVGLASSRGGYLVVIPDGGTATVAFQTS